MNAFKRFALILMSCCVMLSGCGRANESEDSAPDGIIEITPTTQAEEMPEEYDDYDYNNFRTPSTTTYTPDFLLTTTTMAKRRGNVYVASASPAPRIRTVTTAQVVTPTGTHTTVSGTSAAVTTHINAATGTFRTVTTTAAVKSTSVQTTTTRLSQTAPATVTTATVTTYQGISPADQLKKLTLRQKVSQMFIASPDQLSGVKKATAANTTMKRTLADTPVGGIIFTEDNLTSKKQLAALLANISVYLDQSCGIGPMTAVREEGGDASPVSEKLLTSGFYEPAVYGRENDPEHVYSIGKTMGTDLSKLGFKLNLAPPADLSSSGYSSDEHITAELVKNMIRGLKESGVYAAAGNFPGTEMRSGRTLKQLRAVEFLPFKAAVEEGVSFISMGHQRVSGFGDSLPADLSPKAVSCIRNDIGFNGVIISGNMSDDVITEKYSSGEAAAASIKAGTDLILLPADLNDAVDTVCKAVESGEISEERINESVLRILTVKKAMGTF